MEPQDGPLKPQKGYFEPEEDPLEPQDCPFEPQDGPLQPQDGPLAKPKSASASERAECLYSIYSNCTVHNFLHSQTATYEALLAFIGNLIIQNPHVRRGAGSTPQRGAGGRPFSMYGWASRARLVP